ncbi:unnamed protein product [Schistosoma margrebowiei]|uniref:Uncharacterized protein n=1 Tax=Schistosoma margrebowiei TaxID=48269 RepID=A0A183LUE3_9TREM|nr:unnamed protein product [Schistosoma margrebowiei]
MAIRQIKSGKAAGTDNISAEALKPNPETMDDRSKKELNITHNYTSTSLTMRRSFTVWVGVPYGTFDTIEFLRRLLTLSGTHTTDHSALS